MTIAAQHIFSLEDIMALLDGELSAAESRTIAAHSGRVRRMRRYRRPVSRDVASTRRVDNSGAVRDIGLCGLGKVETGSSPSQLEFAALIPAHVQHLATLGSWRRLRPHCPFPLWDVLHPAELQGSSPFTNDEAGGASRRRKAAFPCAFLNPTPSQLLRHRA